MENDSEYKYTVRDYSVIAVAVASFVGFIVILNWFGKNAVKILSE